MSTSKDHTSVQARECGARHRDKLREGVGRTMRRSSHLVVRMPGSTSALRAMDCTSKVTSTFPAFSNSSVALSLVALLQRRLQIL